MSGGLFLLERRLFQNLIDLLQVSPIVARNWRFSSLCTAASTDQLSVVFCLNSFEIHGSISRFDGRGRCKLTPLV